MRTDRQTLLHSYIHTLLKAASGQGTVNNLQATAEVEGLECQAMHPGFLAEPEAEGDRPAQLTTKYALSSDLAVPDVPAMPRQTY